MLLRADTPGLLFLDDVQWADEASLRLLGSVVRRLLDDPLMVLVTWRSEEMPAGHRLRQLVADAGHVGGAITLALSRLRPGMSLSS